MQRINRMDEVWVPTDFHVTTFAASGVDPAKVRAPYCLHHAQTPLPVPPGCHVTKWTGCRASSNRCSSFESKDLRVWRKSAPA